MSFLDSYLNCPLCGKAKQNSHFVLVFILLTIILYAFFASLLAIGLAALLFPSILKNPIAADFLIRFMQLVGAGAYIGFLLWHYDRLICSCSLPNN